MGWGEGGGLGRGRSRLLFYPRAGKDWDLDLLRTDGLLRVD